MSDDLILNSLYNKNTDKYNEIKEQAREFYDHYCKSDIRDNIFSIMKNYAKKEGYELEILRFPIKDLELCAFSAVKSGMLFCMINTFIPLGKQIFAAAHELYHIYCYINEKNEQFISNGSILMAKQMDDNYGEEAVANAFAATILAPATAIVSQMELYDIKKSTLTYKDIVQLMECFAIPYKAMVLRLYECEIIDEKKANALLKDLDKIDKYIEDSGIAKRWSLNTESYLNFGSLVTIMDENEEMEAMPLKRLNEDRERLREILKMLKDK